LVSSFFPFDQGHYLMKRRHQWAFDNDYEHLEFLDFEKPIEFIQFIYNNTVYY